MMLPRFQPVAYVVATWTALAMLAGCDPIRQVSGTVRSVPPTTAAPDPAEVRPLSGVVMKATCGGRVGLMFADPDEGTHVLAISGSDGSFEYMDIGYWAEGCRIEFESGDGSHAPRQFAVSDLCRQTTGDADCLAIKDITVDLVRRREPSPPVEVRVRTTAANVDLRVDEFVTCRAPCRVQVTPGLHRLELLEQGRSVGFWGEQAVVTRDTELTLRFEPHKGRQEAARWFLIPVGAAVLLAPIGAAQKNEALLWTSAGLAVGGTVGFLLVWKSDEVEVTVQPTEP